MNDDWGEPISVYSDEQAVEDGMLVPIPCGRINRATRAVFDWFVRGVGDGRVVADITQLVKACEYMLRLGPDDGWYVGEYEHKKLWVIPNEIGGLTIMFPDDY